MDIENTLHKLLKNFKSAPFLFIGSGFSRRYLGTEDWKNLLKKFCSPYISPFDYYFSSAEGKLNKPATLMAKDFHEVWWKSDIFKDSRKNYCGEMNRIDSPLKFEISKYLSSKKLENLSPDLINEIKHLKEATFDGIITTNWDKLLENIFENKNFDTFIGQKDLLSLNSQEIGEIYKIHGSIDNYNSLVLTEEDYIDFNKRNPYLAAKLLTIFIEHPIIFIGYSISDPNIIEILKSITVCLSSSGLNKLNDNLFFIKPIFDNSEDSIEKSVITTDNLNLKITVIEAKNYTPIYKTLAKYKRKLSAKQISKTMYKSITYTDLLEDIILDNKDYEPKNIILETIPSMQGAKNYVPFYKYLNKGGFLNKSDINAEVCPKLVSRYNTGINEFITQQIREKMGHVQEEISATSTFEFNLNPNEILLRILQCSKESIDINAFKLSILSNIDKLRDKSYKNLSILRKMIRIYDWLVYSKI